MKFIYKLSKAMLMKNKDKKSHDKGIKNDDKKKKNNIRLCEEL